MSKYPRTFHLPYSPGKGKDDKVMKDVSSLLGKRLGISEKMDGSNTCLGRDYLYARSHAAIPSHSSFSFLKQYHAGMKSRIPYDTSIFVEYCYAVHSIVYGKLRTPFFVIGVRSESDGIWLDIPSMLNVATSLGMPIAPMLTFPTCETERDLEEAVKYAVSLPPKFGDLKEGIVVRTFDQFHDEDFKSCVAKWVRKDHVQTDEHWSHAEVVKHPSLFGD